MRRQLAVLAVFVGFATVPVLVAACGGTDVEAPRATVVEGLDKREQCKGFDQLMPNFVRAIQSGKTENLRKVISEHLLKPEREGEPPPINDVLRAVFTTLTAFAKQPPEKGAPAGDVCATPPPPLSQANELCEMRRTIDLLVHQGKGIEAIKVLEPQLNGLLTYVTGGNAGPARERPGDVVFPPNYKIAQIIAGGCAQSAQCKLEYGLDLVIGMTRYLESPAGKKLQADLDALTAPTDGGGILGLLDPNNLDEEGFIAIVKVVLPALQAATPQSLDDLLKNPPLSNYKASLQPVVDDLKVLLMDQQITNAMKRSLACIYVQGCETANPKTCNDPNLDLMRMLYRVAISKDTSLPAFGLTKLTGVLKGVREVDQRGSLLHLTGTLAKAVREDESAVNSAANVCRTMFRHPAPVGTPKSNAELALPVLADLVKQGVINEGICAIDTLLFGCAGGAQPACQ